MIRVRLKCWKIGCEKYKVLFDYLFVIFHVLLIIYLSDI